MKQLFKVLLFSFSFIFLVDVCINLVYKFLHKTNKTLISHLEMPPPVPDSIRTKVALAALVFAISGEDAIECDYIGFAGRKSTQPNYAKLLEVWADTNQLAVLTNHANSLVRVLGFDVLAKKKFHGLQRIFDQHLDDTGIYYTYCGCGKSPNSVNISYYGTIQPFLSTNDLKKYYN